MPNLHLCKLCLCSKSSSGVYPITLRGSFSTSHFLTWTHLLEAEESSNCGVASTVENIRLRSGCEKSHCMSSTKAQEGPIFRFDGGHVSFGFTTVHMQSPSRRAYFRGAICCRSAATMNLRGAVNRQPDYRAMRLVEKAPTCEPA